MRALLLVITASLAVAITSACKQDTRAERQPQQVEEDRWNEVPLRLYGTDHGLKAGWMTGLVWNKASGEKSDCDLDFYLRQSNRIPKLKEFMKYAVASSNGFDQADCWSMLDIVSDEDDAENESKRREAEQRVKEALR